MVRVGGGWKSLEEMLRPRGIHKKAQNGHQNTTANDVHSILNNSQVSPLKEQNGLGKANSPRSEASPTKPPTPYARQSSTKSKASSMSCKYSRKSFTANINLPKNAQKFHVTFSFSCLVVPKPSEPKQ